MAATDERAWRDAAALIADADFLLVAAGAGFSADSGLPVYNDIASVQAYEKLGMDYQDLCDPNLLDDDAELFYGFWGSCFNAYRDTASHRGYDILRAWKQRLVHKRSSDASAFRRTFEQLQRDGALPPDVTLDAVTSDPFFVYTSNVDAHFLRTFASREVYELHGNVERWQCAGKGKGTGTGQAQQPCDAVWDVVPDCRFDVDAATMTASGAACRHCGGHARPSVLMFRDTNWISNVADESRYVAWEAVVEQMLQDDPSLRLVVLEIGCGLRVPSVRTECEMVVADVFARCSRAQATLVRVNPDAAQCDHEVLTANALALAVPTTGLAALEAIDELLTTTTSE